MGGGERPLQEISESFQELAVIVNSKNLDVEVSPFCRACSRVSVLFACLGIAFKFGEIDYVAKVKDLEEASKTISTLQSILDHDVRQNTVKKAGSHSRNLLRVKRGLDMVRVLFENLLVTEHVEGCPGALAKHYCIGSHKNARARALEGYPGKFFYCHLGGHLQNG